MSRSTESIIYVVTVIVAVFVMTCTPVASLGALLFALVFGLRFVMHLRMGVARLKAQEFNRHSQPIRYWIIIAIEGVMMIGFGSLFIWLCATHQFYRR
jgi:hypothetical protein